LVLYLVAEYNAGGTEWRPGGWKLLFCSGGEAAGHVVSTVGGEEIVHAVADLAHSDFVAAISPTLIRLRFVEEMKTPRRSRDLQGEGPARRRRLPFRAAISMRMPR